MRRIAALTIALGLIAVGMGCKHVGGKCDCQSNPNDAVPLSPSAPYSANRVLTVPPGPAQMPAAMPAPGAGTMPVTPMR